MAWHECINGNYVLCFRVGEKRFRRSLNSDDEGEADSAVACIEENLRLIERGRLEIPKGVDVLSFCCPTGRSQHPSRSMSR
jgi:hypothetical protein